MYDRDFLIKKYGEEEVRDAEKQLSKITWFGDKEEMVKSIIKRRSSQFYS